MLNLQAITLLLLCLQLASSKPNDKSEITEDAELIFAHVIFRHGDRNPLVSYPKDPFSDEANNWPEGYGQLTNVGKQQHFELGKYLRKRYKSLLGNGSYSPNTVFIQSTDVDRTIMSAQCNLAGLFPPSDDQVWNPNIAWQPIPIHSVPKRYDYVVNGEAYCPRFDAALEEYKQTPEYKNIFIKHSRLIEYLEANTGLSIEDLIAIQNLNNTLFIQSIKNKTLPEWTHKVFPGGDLNMLTNLCFTINTSTPTLARLKIGFLLREMLDRFEEKIESKLNPNRTLWIYSAHDSTIASVLNSIGLFKLESPPYASCLLVELYKEKEEFYFQILYRKSTSENLLPLDIPLCGTKCSIEKFRQAYKDIVPTGVFEDECAL